MDDTGKVWSEKVVMCTVKHSVTNIVNYAPTKSQYLVLK